MLTLQQVTLKYSPQEDRIGMSAKSAEGGTLHYWLTNRICRNIVKTIVDKLDAEALSQSSSQGAVAVQAFMHQKAKSARKASKPVTGTPQSSQLVDRLKIRISKIGVFLYLPAGEEEAVLPFRKEEARQWLEILRNQFDVAGWSKDVFPSWMTAKETGPKTGSVFH